MNIDINEAIYSLKNIVENRSDLKKWERDKALRDLQGLQKLKQEWESQKLQLNQQDNANDTK